MRLLDQVRNELRVKHYSIRTEKSYIDWIKRFIAFNSNRHPKDLGGEKIKEYINWLAISRNVSASTQNQALCSILFLYKQVLKSKIDWIDEIRWAKRPKKLPVVFTEHEVERVLSTLEGAHLNMASIM